MRPATAPPSRPSTERELLRPSPHRSRADSPPHTSNVAELLAERGYVSIIRHRQGDEQRSSDYDKLMAAEAKAVAEAKGVHSGKEFPLSRIIDASEVSPPLPRVNA